MADYIDALHDHHFAAGADPVTRNARVHDLMRAAEVAAVAPLLDYLAARNDLRLIGPREAGARAPTVAVALDRPAEPVSEALGRDGIACWAGDFYAVRPLEAMGVDLKRGVLRMSLVHYTSPDEVARLIKALDKALTRGSWGARGVLRYKQRYRYGGTLDLTHNTKLNGDPEFTTFSRDRTYFLRWTHTVDSRASLRNRFNAQLNLGSSNSFTNNLNSSQTDYLSNTFQSNLGWTRLWPGRPFTASLSATHNQNTLTREFNITLPSITFNLQRVFPGTLLRPADAVGEERWYERIGVTYAMNFDNQLRTTEDRLSFSNMNRLVGDFRNGIRHTAGASTRVISGGMALASGLILGFIFSAGALGLLFTGPLAENYGFPTVLMMTTGLVLLASPLAWMLREKKAEEVQV